MEQGKIYFDKSIWVGEVKEWGDTEKVMWAYGVTRRVLEPVV